MKQQQFASDNYSGICPEAMKYLIESNQNHDFAYGEDQWTAKATNLFRQIFETDCEVFFVFNGTAANSLALSALCQSYHSIICHELAHIETDECGAPEFFSNGAKILLAPGNNGKLSPHEIEKLVIKRKDIHYPKPKVISITQATETGTVYSHAELLGIADMAKKYQLKIHMDGARFANALATLDLSPKDITWKAGVDVLCFGGIKNGIGLGEAIIFFNKELAEEFDYRCKQAGQLASKMRFISSQWIGILENNVWLKNAIKANAAAKKLEDELKNIPQVKITFPRQANSVFVQLPPDVISRMQAKGWHFYTFIGLGDARFMCSWDTSDQTIQTFVSDLKELCAF